MNDQFESNFKFDEEEEKKIEEQLNFLNKTKEQVDFYISTFLKKANINDKLDVYLEICRLETEMNDFGLVTYDEQVSDLRDEISQSILSFENNDLEYIKSHLVNIYKTEVEQPLLEYEAHLAGKLEEQKEKMFGDRDLQRDPKLDNKWDVVQQAKQYLIPKGESCDAKGYAAIIITVKEHMYENRKILLDERDGFIMRILKKLFTGWGAKNDIPEFSDKKPANYEKNIGVTLWGTTKAEKILLKPMKIETDMNNENSGSVLKFK